MGSSTVAQPFMKFYPQDWRADEKLRNCTLAARGLWLEMLALMHRSERYGQLLINGSVPTDMQLAVQVGAPLHEVTALLADLEKEGVFSRSAKGTIYSRRMIRDEKKAKNARQNGRAGGNPRLRSSDEKQSGNLALDKGQVKPAVKAGDKPQIPEARNQRPDIPIPEPAPVPPREPEPPADVKAVLEAGGYISPPGDLALLKRWYAGGADLQQDILPVIRRVRPTLAKAPFTLKVFDAAIREKLAEDQREIDRLRRYSARREAEERQQAAGAR